MDRHVLQVMNVARPVRLRADQPHAPRMCVLRSFLRALSQPCLRDSLCGPVYLAGVLRRVNQAAHCAPFTSSVYSCYLRGYMHWVWLGTDPSVRYR